MEKERARLVVLMN
ncbi:hypothetical protein F383_39315 [Gossypium arboreum]|uniref:Uncharacterized protein n=1 Tax=Gossypium arboreum TaxID=29729 RepID=A0A0B0MNT1_GOSAR|nr:hypothetical protein F383_39315 [Gossypium arboreum]